MKFIFLSILFGSKKHFRKIMRIKKTTKQTNVNDRDNNKHAEESNPIREIIKEA